MRGISYVRCAVSGIRLLETVEALGYRIYLDRLNIIGIRAASHAVDRFDDFLTVIQIVSWVPSKTTAEGTTPGRKEVRAGIPVWPITTDPGKNVLVTPKNSKGAAILAPGQYDAYAIDKHAGKYLALCQRRGPVSVFRDNDRDAVHDFVNVESGWFGINIHASASEPYTTDKVSTLVQGWSEGCQVFQNSAHFREFMALCTEQAKTVPEFTYTLLVEDSLPEEVREWLKASKKS